MVDNERHHTGVFSDKVNDAIKEMDYLLGEIIKALKEAEIFDKTDIADCHEKIPPYHHEIRKK